LKIKVAKDGVCSFRSGSPPDVGEIWIEGDKFCFRWNLIGGSKKCCCTVFRNPEGNPEKKNEYIDMCDTRAYLWSPVK